MIYDVKEVFEADKKDYATWQILAKATLFYFLIGVFLRSLTLQLVKVLFCLLMSLLKGFLILLPAYLSIV